MAEVVLRKLSNARGGDLAVRSRGISDVTVGRGPDERAVAALVERGYDPTPHQAQRVQEVDIQWATVILVMETAQCDWLSAHEYAHNSIHLLSRWASGSCAGVPDPYYGTRSDFDSTLDLIEQTLESFLKWRFHALQ